MSTSQDPPEPQGPATSAWPERWAERPRARIVLAVLAMLMAVCGEAPAASPSEPIQPIPVLTKQDSGRTDLGRRLFADKRLSGNGLVSCASCHDLQHGGADTRARSIGLHGALTEVNTPSVLNAALNFRQFWNGRADSLESQVDQVIRSPNEMGSDWASVIRVLMSDPSYRSSFAAAYDKGITQSSVQSAIATFERTLVTPNARFDRYLRGDTLALSEAEKNGYVKFKQYGCVSCHQGVNIGGNMFQKFGVMGDYFASRGNVSTADLGRFLVTHDERDRYVFKVPSLRNVALRAPYFHDGSAKTLEAAVDVMFTFQVGRPAPKDDRQAIVQFLHSLTGDLQLSP